MVLVRDGVIFQVTADDTWKESGSRVPPVEIILPDASRDTGVMEMMRVYFSNVVEAPLSVQVFPTRSIPEAAVGEREEKFVFRIDRSASSPSDA